MSSRKSLPESFEHSLDTLLYDRSRLLFASIDDVTTAMNYQLPQVLIEEARVGTYPQPQSPAEVPAPAYSDRGSVTSSVRPVIGEVATTTLLTEPEADTVVHLDHIRPDARQDDAFPEIVQGIAA